MKKLITLLLIIASFSLSAQTNYKNMVGTFQSKDTTGGKNVIFNGSTIGIIPFVTTPVLKDSLKNYAQIQDGLISGGSATIGSGTVTIATANYRINKTNYTTSSRTFTGISNSPSGTQYYLVVYGKTNSTLDTISGARDSILVLPTLPANTVAVNTIIVGSGGVESAVADLSGFLTILNNQDVLSTKTFKRSIFSDISQGVGDFFGVKGDTLLYSFYRDINDNFNFATYDNSQLSTNITYVVDRLNNVLDFKTLPTINGEAISTANATDYIENRMTQQSSSSFNVSGNGAIGNDLQFTSNAGNGILTENSSRLVSITNGLFNVSGGNMQANNIIRNGGTSSQFLKADGSVDATDYAPIASPTFTGTPIAPTATANTNNTQIATTSYADAKVQNSLTASTTIAPSATAVNTGLALKANIASPTFTGTVTTPILNVSTTPTTGVIEQIDLGAVAGALITDGSNNISVAPAADRTIAGELTKSANYTVTLSDFGSNGMLTVYCNTTGGDVTITLPSPTVMRYLEVTLVKETTGNNMIVSGSANINGSSSVSHSAQYKSLTIVSNGTQYYIKSERP